MNFGPVSMRLLLLFLSFDSLRLAALKVNQTFCMLFPYADSDAAELRMRMHAYVRVWVCVCVCIDLEISVVIFMLFEDLLTIPQIVSCVVRTNLQYVAPL